ncbi:MAG: hypothetical protein RLP12_12005 [Ekhidna sp.]
MMGEIKSRFLGLEKTRHSLTGFKKLIWDLFSMLGDTFFKSPPPVSPPEIYHGLKLLNLGAGAVKLEGFVNADFYRLHKIWSPDRPDWMLDITKPICCPDNYWDGVLIEHTNEHILYSQNYDLFSELYRTLKPNSIVRIVVPDLDKYLDWSDLRKAEPKMNRYASLPEAISNLAQNHAHVSVWNFQLLKDMLTEIGFIDVRRMNFLEGNMPELLKDSPRHVWQSVYLEAKKPPKL